MKIETRILSGADAGNPFRSTVWVVLLNKVVQAYCFTGEAAHILSTKLKEIHGS